MHSRCTCVYGVRGSKGFAVMGALVSHQCGPGSNPGVDAICGLGLLLVPSLVPRGFSPCSPVFLSPRKPTFPNSNSIRNQVDKEPLCGCTCATSKSLSLLLIIILLQKDAGQVALDEEERLRMLLEVCASLLFRNRLWQVKNSLEPW